MKTQGMTTTLLVLLASLASGVLVPAWAATGTSETFARTESVLDHFGVPAEPDSQEFFSDLQNQGTVAAVRSALPFLDLKGAFARYSTIIENADGSGELRVYQDPDSKQVLDYSVQLAASPAESVENFHARLLAASRNPSDQQLAGLRIALDPGHMGGDFWDEETGKFVRDSRGRKLSEGVMALQIAFLLEQKFKALGAEVFITHRSLAPVSNLPYQNFDLRPFGLRNLGESVTEDWFTALVGKYSAGNSLYSAFSVSNDFKALFSESKRWQYFILGADLDARVEAIRAFQADLTLVIHLDTDEPPGNPTGVNIKPYDGTKAYVAGGFFEDEFASRADRKFFGRHLVDPVEWKASVQLARAVVHQIRDRMGVPFDGADPQNSLQVEPGVLARNLNVQRKLTGQAVAYVECLFYNDPSEFAALLNASHPMQIDGVSYPYSDRLAQIADALDSAVTQFVRDYGSTQ